MDYFLQYRFSEISEWHAFGRESELDSALDAMRSPTVDLPHHALVRILSSKGIEAFGVCVHGEIRRTGKIIEWIRGPEFQNLRSLNLFNYEWEQIYDQTDVVRFLTLAARCRVLRGKLVRTVSELPKRWLSKAEKELLHHARLWCDGKYDGRKIREETLNLWERESGANAGRNERLWAVCGAASTIWANLEDFTVSSIKNPTGWAPSNAALSTAGYLAFPQQFQEDYNRIRDQAILAMTIPSKKYISLADLVEHISVSF